MKKRKKKKFNLKKLIILLFLFLFIGSSIYYLLNVRVKNIIVLNNNYYSDDDIIYTAKIDNYPKFLLLNKKLLENRIKKLDLIDDVNITKKYGFILNIDVKEKEILYYIRSSDLYMLSDYNTIMLENVYGKPTLINYVPEKLEEQFVKKFKNVDRNVIGLISEIEYSKTNYDDKRFLLYMNDGNLVYVTISKLDILNKYINIVQKLEGKKGILYLDTGNYFEVKEK